MTEVGKGCGWQAVKRGFGTIAVEISIGPAGVTTAICFDDDGDRERVLLQVGTRGGGSE